MPKSTLHAGVKSCGSKMVYVSVNVQFTLVTITDLGGASAHFTYQ